MADDIAAWLSGLGVGKYVETFRANDIDIRAARYLTEGDLRELGVSLGHRKILLAAIALLGVAAPPSNSATVASLRVTTEAERSGQAEQAERRLLSVLFCDLVGSTALARRLDPEDMRALLRSYQDRVAGAITRYGGHVAQYLGDGVMAFFGWPTAFEDQAERAVRAGLEALEAVQTLGIVGGLHVQARVGIATERVVVGDFSSAGRQEGTFAGYKTAPKRISWRCRKGPGSWLARRSRSRILARAPSKASTAKCAFSVLSGLATLRAVLMPPVVRSCRALLGGFTNLPSSWSVGSWPRPEKARLC